MLLKLPNLMILGIIGAIPPLFEPPSSLIIFTFADLSNIKSKDFAVLLFGPLFFAETASNFRFRGV